MHNRPTHAVERGWRHLPTAFLIGAAILLGLGRQSQAIPPPHITSPPGGTWLREGDTIRLEATAFGNVLKVEFYADGGFLGEVSPAPFTLFWSNVVIGVHELTAVAVDDALARGTSAVAVVTVAASQPLDLIWGPTGTTSGEWNQTTLNWRSGGRPTVYHDGDTVVLPMFQGTTVFIGTAGVPMAVSPAGTTFQGNCGIHGGDILTGSVVVRDPSAVTFSNYSGSLSFPGGTTILPSSSSILTYDLSSAPNGAVAHFGTGPIVLNGTFAVQAASNRLVTLENDFAVNQMARLLLNPRNRPNAVVRLTGEVSLGETLLLTMGASGGGYPAEDNSPYEWAGPVVIKQSGVVIPRIQIGSSYNGKGLLISGGISDGPGPWTNQLRLWNYNAAFIRLTGTNTYAQGTVVESTLYGPVEVGPNSSLGTGNLLVEYSGVVRLMGNGNLASTAEVVVQGRAILDSGVKVRISSLTLGSSTFTNGLFTFTNSSGFLRSNGTFRLPALNLPPTVALTSPVEGVTYGAGDTIVLQAAVMDVDSYLARVEFRVNGALFGVRTNAPFEISLRNAPAGQYPVEARVYDDDGGVGFSAVTLTVAPRITRIQSLYPAAVFIEFNSPMNQACVLEAADLLPFLLWTNIGSYPAEPISRSWRVTNAVAEEVPGRLYRLRVPGGP